VETTAEQIRYITDAQGERVGVLLDIAFYHRLIDQAAPDPEFLVGLSQSELEALAESKLAPTAQQRLEELLEHNLEGKLTSEESEELDHLLEQIDQLTILKTRARYTLQQLAVIVA
jgi:hypothetical protein